MHSKTTEVTSGVPQGTVLGPLLFLVYINDMPETISSTARLFADDSLVYRIIRTEEDQALLQKDLDKLQKWERDWLMQFNPDKCEVIRITNKRKGAQWLSGRVLDSRPKGRGFEPHRHHCVVSLSKNINPSLVLVQPRKTSPFITERLLMGHKELNQTNQQKEFPHQQVLHP